MCSAFIASRLSVHMLTSSEVLKWRHRIRLKRRCSRRTAVEFIVPSTADYDLSTCVAHSRRCRHWSASASYITDSSPVEKLIRIVTVPEWQCRNSAHRRSNLRKRFDECTYELESCTGTNTCPHPRPSPHLSSPSHPHYYFQHCPHPRPILVAFIPIPATVIPIPNRPRR